MIRPALLALALGLASFALAPLRGTSAEPGPEPPACAVPAELVALGPPLTQAADKLRRGDRLTIVALGSSSTQGVGASAPSETYPSRLAAELRRRFRGLDVVVVNRGRNGEDARQELERMDRDVLAERPDVVIWQLGTNAVLRRDDVSQDGELIRQGIERLKQGGSEVVLMDLQYAPRVLARPHYPVMEHLIADAAKSERAGLFRRFEIMHYWHDAPVAEAAPMIGPDGLHMNDRGYHCMAADLADALADNWRAAGLSAATPASGHAALAAGGRR
jgi:lysophospholipase L1-like esterase